MGERGPLPGPSYLKVLKGGTTDSKGHPQPKPLTAVPRAPSSLDKEGQRVWRETAAELVERGLLTGADLTVLAVYAQNVAILREAERRVALEGSVLTGKRGQEYLHPCVRVAHNSAKVILALAKEFGLTPASRRRLHVEPAPGQEDPLFAAIRKGQEYNPRGNDYESR